MSSVLQALSLVVLFAFGSQASIFNRLGVAHQTEEVSEECMAHARAGNCEFYDCFERRLPCGPLGYVVKYGQYYCAKIQRERHHFTPEAQEFLDHSKTCMMEALLEAYQQDMVDCHRLKHTAIESISRCYIQHGFCGVFPSNTDEFMDIFETEHLLSPGSTSIFSEVMELTTTCLAETVRDLTSETTNALSEMASNAWNALTSVFRS